MANRWITTSAPCEVQPLDPQGLAFNPALPQPIFCTIGSAPRLDLISKKFGTTIAAETFAATKYGIGLRTLRLAFSGIGYGTAAAAPRIKSDSWTILVLANPAANSNLQTLLSQRMSGAPYQQLNLQANYGYAGAAPNGTLSIGLVDATTGSLGSQSASAVIDGNYRVLCTTRASAGTIPKLYVDGKPISITSSAAAQSTINAAQELHIGSPGDYPTDAGGYATNCDIVAVIIYPSVLSDAQIAYLGETPNAIWRAFELRRRRYSALASAFDAAAAARRRLMAFLYRHFFQHS